jgi:hypothetical protein
MGLKLKLLIAICTLAGLGVITLTMAAIFLGPPRVTNQPTCRSHTTGTPAAPATVSTSAPAAAAAATNPHALTVANVTRSLHDNMREAPTTIDQSKITVNVDNDKVNITTTAGAMSATDVFKQDSFLTYDAVRAILGCYPDVYWVHVEIDGSFTPDINPIGLSDTTPTTGPAAWIEVSSYAAYDFDYDRLLDRVLDDPSTMYYLADHYYIHDAIWKKLSSRQRGQISAVGNES